MKYLTLRYQNGRFKEGALPMDYLAALARWHKALVSLAADKWRHVHQGQKLPADFKESLKLELELSKGSTKVAVNYAQVAQHEQQQQQTYFGDTPEDMRQVATANVPTWVSVGTLDDIDRIWEGLTANETVEVGVPGATSTPALIDAAVRVSLRAIAEARLVTRNQPDYFIGSVQKVDKANRRFSIHIREGRSPRNFVLKDEHRDDVMASLVDNEKKVLLWLSANAEYIGGSRGVASVDEVCLIRGPIMSHRLTELERIAKGWSNGVERPPTQAHLQRVSKALWTLLQQCRWDRPYLYPIPDGGVSAEWSFTKGRADIDFFADGRVVAGAVVGEDDEFDLEMAELDSRTVASLVEWMNKVGASQ